MNSAEYERWIKARIRGPLSAKEQAELSQFLAANPQWRQQWEQDIALHLLVRKLPEPPISNNFTSVVLRQIEAETRRERASRTPRFVWGRWVRPLAYASFATVLVAGGLVYQRGAERAAMAESAATVTAVAQLVQPRQAPSQFIAADREFPPLPPMDIWQNFDAIRALPNDVDTDLLFALQ